MSAEHGFCSRTRTRDTYARETEKCASTSCRSSGRFARGVKCSADNRLLLKGDSGLEPAGANADATAANSGSSSSNPSGSRANDARTAISRWSSCKANCRMGSGEAMSRKTSANWSRDTKASFRDDVRTVNAAPSRPVESLEPDLRGNRGCGHDHRTPGPDFLVRSEGAAEVGCCRRSTASSSIQRARWPLPSVHAALELGEQPTSLDQAEVCSIVVGLSHVAFFHKSGTPVH